MTITVVNESPELAGKHSIIRVISTVFAVTAVVVIASTILTYWFGNRVLQSNEREKTHRVAISLLEQLISSVKDAETGQRGFVISGDEKYLEPYDAAVQEAPRLLSQLRSLGDAGIDGTKLDEAQSRIDRKMRELQTTIGLRKSSGPEAAAAAVQTGEGKALMDELRAGINEMKAQQETLLQREVDISNATTRTRTLVFAFTALINIGFLVWAYRRIADLLRQRDVALGAAHDRGRQLQEQKDLLSVTLRSIGDCVIVTDEEGRINFMNEVAEEVTRWNFGEARGRPAGEVFHILNETTRARVESPVEKVIREGVTVGLANHTVLVRRDGSEIPIDDSGAPIRDAEGKMCGVVLVFRDFSEHRQSEKNLRAAKEEAETASKVKDQFLAMLSHELRTPLTPVLATLNLWETGADLPPAMRNDLQMLRRSVELEARIIDDLLDLTRIARGMLSFTPEHTNAHALIEFMVGLSQSELREKQLEVDLHLEAPRHFVHLDAARMQQVLWNVLRNAVKFTDSGGRIVITTSNNAEKGLVIFICDTGIGMTRHTLQRLFTPFEQAESSRSSQYGGLGLGMAISSALVELLGGKIAAESEGLGRGSTFTISFPTVEASSEEQKTPAQAPSPGKDKPRLLLVEDHADTARALTRLLESRGYQIRAENSVAQGLQALKEERFEMILCDLGLPDGTGFDFLTTARKTNNTPAIALTGFGMQQDVQRAGAAGFAAHLTKPVNLQKLEATIWSVLQAS